MRIKNYDNLRRPTAEAPSKLSLRGLSPLQAQHARTIAYQAALEVLG